MFGFKKKENDEFTVDSEKNAHLESDSENLAVPEVKVEGVEVEDENDKEEVTIDFDGAVPEYHVINKKDE